MKRVKKYLAFFLVLVLALSVTGCTSSTNSNKGPINIGFIGCISGADAYLGQTAVLALQDEVKAINDKGGILGREVKLISYDIGLDPTPETINATNRLIQQDHVVAIIGPESSDQAIAAVDIVQAAKVPMIVTTASNTAVTVKDNGTLNDYMFRMCFIDPYQGTALADYAYDSLGLRKIAVLGDIANLYTQGIQKYFETEFKAKGGTITSEEGFVDTDTEFRAPLTNIKNSDAQAILIATGTYKIAGYIGQQCKQLGMTQKILGVDGWYSNELIPFAGKDLDGALMSCMIDDQAAEFADYRNSFVQKHPGQTVNYFAYYAVDALKLIQWAINQKQSANPTDIKDAMSTAKDVPLFTCNITIDPKTHDPLNKPIYILKVTPKGFETTLKFVPGKK